MIVYVPGGRSAVRDFVWPELILPISGPSGPPMSASSLTLPARYVTHHFDVAWVGFDLMMACVALWTVLSIVRSSKYLPIAASVTGTFLVCDAWFDLVTSRPGSELVQSSLLAGAGELPLAALCFWMALDAERICERRARYFERRRSARAGATA